MSTSPTTQSNSSKKSVKSASNSATFVQNPPPIPDDFGGFAPETADLTPAQQLDAPANATGIHEEKLAAVWATQKSDALQNLCEAWKSPATFVSENRGGRPTSFDAITKQKVCLLVQFGYSRTLAAAEVGVARSTLTRALKSDSEFRQQVLEAEKLFERGPLLTIVAAAQKNWQAAVWLLKNFQPSSVVLRKRLAEERETARAKKAWHKMTSEIYK